MVEILVEVPTVLMVMIEIIPMYGGRCHGPYDSPGGGGGPSDNPYGAGSDSPSSSEVGRRCRHD